VPKPTTLSDTSVLPTWRVNIVGWA